MKIAVDAMGGDYAPEAILEGALLATPQSPAEMVLFGDKFRIHGILERLGKSSSVEVVHTNEVIGMDEPGPVAVRKKRDASLSLAMRFLGENQVDAVVSAGNTSAIVAAAKHFVGLTSGLRRPALAVPLPTPTGKVLLIDAGAHAEANAIHLAQSAALANAYLEVAERCDSPRVGLLNIGQEPGKGKKLVRRAFALLSRSGLNFIGNVEPQELFSDRADAVVCDGFVGNVLIKMIEGLSETLLLFLETQASEHETADQGMGIPPQLLRRFREVYHYQSMGGAPLLGPRRVVVIAHGRSQGSAIANAIHLAVRLTDEGIVERMMQRLDRSHILAELKHQYTLLMLDQLRSKWSFAQRQ